MTKSTPFQLLDWAGDDDQDGLTNGLEWNYGTDPLKTDSDGDLLPDDWEIQCGLNPTAADGNANGISDADEDADGDGLGNLAEHDNSSDPTAADTDLDGIPDAMEVAQGSDPTDASDGGQELPSDMVGTFRLTAGDSSGSHSELWALTVGSKTYTAPGFGEVGSADYIFESGESYDITLRHMGTDPDFLRDPGAGYYPENTTGPNYDWTAAVDKTQGDVQYWIDDPYSTAPEIGPEGGDEYKLLQEHIWNVIGPPNLTAGKTAHLHIFQLDADVDSNNDSGFDEPTDNMSEDRTELDSTTGKIIWANTGDVDSDGIVDTSDYCIADGHFVPLVVRLSDNVSAADPTTIATSITYDSSVLRVWTKDASTQRTAQDIIPSGGSVSGLSPGDNGKVVLYVEALTAADAPQAIDIAAEVTSPKWTGTKTLTDQVYVFAPYVLTATMLSHGLDVGQLPHNKNCSPGAYLPANIDDADNNGQWDCDQSGPILNERYLLPITLHSIPNAGTSLYKVRFRSTDGAVSIWRDIFKISRVTDGAEFPAGIDTILFVEGLPDRADTEVISVDLIDGATTIARVDQVTMHVFQLNGPTAAPELSTYTYAVTGGQSGHTAWLDLGSGTYVGAQPTSGSDSAMITWSEGPATGVITYQASDDYNWNLYIDVVQVQVTWGSESFSPGTPSSGPTVNDSGEACRVIRSYTLDEATNWRVSVTLNGPNGQRGVSQIRIGFIQNCWFPVAVATYDDGSQRVLSIQGNGYLDVASLEEDGSPYYSEADGPPPRTFFQPTPANRTKEIGAEDGPSINVPLANDDAHIVSVSYTMAARTYVVASAFSSDWVLGSGVYTALAELDWEFVANGTFDSSFSYVWNGVGARVESTSGGWVDLHPMGGRTPVYLSGTLANAALLTSSWPQDT